MSSATILAESKHSGMPPPGCTEPPQKYSPGSRPEKLGCRQNAASALLLELP